MPAPRLKGSMSFCAMSRLASLGRGRKANKSNICCPGALETFRYAEPGTEAVSGKRLHGMGLYATRKLAADVQSSMAKLSKPCFGISTIPLPECARSPVSLFLVVDAYQAMRLTQGWAYHHGEMRDMSVVGNRGVCSEGVARPLNTGSPNLTPLCANTRHTAKWQDGELGFGLPFDGVESLVDGLIHTIPAVEPEKRRQSIIERSEKAGLDLYIPPGKCYFQRL